MKKNYFWMSLILLCCFSTALHAARIDTLQVRSHKMKRTIETLVLVPELQDPGERIPTLYLLHGYSDNGRSWFKKKPELAALADRDHVLIVCPSGENSWYWDSPLQPRSQFETFVSQELVAYIDSHYPTRSDRNARAITGLSMGGHGSLWLAIRHKDVFGACGSMSGGVDIRPFPKNWEMYKQLGSLAEHPERWAAHTVMTQLDKIQNGDLAILFDCGSGDFFFKVNCQLHEALEKRGIYHDFTIRPGVHNWAYWTNSIEYHWLFFTRYFHGYRTRIR